GGGGAIPAVSRETRLGRCPRSSQARPGGKLLPHRRRAALRRGSALGGRSDTRPGRDREGKDRDGLRGRRELLRQQRPHPRGELGQGLARSQTTRRWLGRAEGPVPISRERRTGRRRGGKMGHPRRLPASQKPPEFVLFVLGEGASLG